MLLLVLVVGPDHELQDPVRGLPCEVGYRRWLPPTNEIHHLGDPRLLPLGQNLPRLAAGQVVTHLLGWPQPPEEHLHDEGRQQWRATYRHRLRHMHLLDWHHST